MWWRSLPVSFDGSGPSDPNVVNTEEERAMVRSHSRSRRPLGSMALGMSAVLAWYGCGGEPRDVTAPESQSSSVSLQPLEQGFERARAAQERHTRRLLAIEGVTGTAVGFANDGRAVVTIFTKVGGIHGLPTSLDDVPVVVAVTGELFALGNFRRGGVAPRDFAPSVPCTLPPAVTPAGEFCPPVPIGVSTGNVTAADCATGTIAARVKGTGTVYALSNNHVYALTNRAPLGSLVAQPGLVDDGCVTPEIDNDATLSDVIGPLAAFQTIAFCHGHKCPANTIDAAIASSTTDELGDGTPAGGYGSPAKGSGVSASVGQSVEKYGRTTALTTGTVTGINASVLVSYGSGKTALFVHQIVFENSGLPVIGAGDSGSLLVTNDVSHSAVGLLFAGNASGSMAIGNPIGAVLTRFGVTID